MVNQNQAQRCCIIEMPCMLREEYDVCAAIYSIAKHKFVGGHIERNHSDRIIYAQFPGQYIMLVRSWHVKEEDERLRRACRLTAALIRVTRNCRVVPLKWRSIESHRFNAMGTLLMRQYEYNPLPPPLRDFYRYVPQKVSKLLGKTYGELETKWLLAFIQHGDLERLSKEVYLTPPGCRPFEPCTR